MKKLVTIGIALGLLIGLAGCKSDPMCWLADDTVGCLVVTNK